MTGVETQILKIVKKLKEPDEKMIAAEMRVSVSHASKFCSLMVREGLLEKNDRGKFVATRIGFEAKPFNRPGARWRTSAGTHWR